MKHAKKLLLGAGAVIAGVLLQAGANVPPALAADKIITIGTGAVTGVYYPAGGAICRLVNRGRKEHGIRCSVESTGGSIDNLYDLHNGEIQLAVVQSDWLYHAYNGSEVFADHGPNKKLKAVFALHSEPFTVIARKDSKINGFDDLKGKRVNIGNQGSGMRATMEELMRKKGWTNKTFSQLAEFKANEQVQAICNNKIDAMIYAVGHPNGAVQQVTSSCPTKIVNVQGATMDDLIRDYPFYTYAVIPGGMYPGNAQDVLTFGVRAILAATDDLGEDEVYQLVAAVFDNLDNFKTLHPVFATLDPKKMASAGNVIPLHPGAIRYFKEKGLLSSETK